MSTSLTSTGSAMCGTVATPRRISDYKPQPLAAAEKLAAKLSNVEVGTIGQRIRGRDPVNHQVASIVLGYIAAGHLARARQFAKPVTDALAGIRPVPFSRDLFANAQGKDLREDADDNALQLVDPLLSFATVEARATGRRDVASKREAAAAELLLADAMEAAINEAEARAEAQE